MDFQVKNVVLRFSYVGLTPREAFLAECEQFALSLCLVGTAMPLFFSLSLE
jgi:hypothetical protein